jgi:hypothetical protein
VAELVDAVDLKSIVLLWACRFDSGLGHQMSKKVIRLPFNFRAREYQKPLFNFILDGGKRAFWCVHRRAGKDLTCWNLMACMAYARKGVYYYLLPTYAQGKKIIWDGIDAGGNKFIEYIPKPLVSSMNGTEMKITLKNGSVIQVIGTDNYDSIMGTNPVGCVFSEYSLQNPDAWGFIRPILAENGGWAVFNGTPRGRNHFWDMYQMAKQNPDWFCQRMGVEETKALSLDVIEEERQTGMSEALIQQEYYCSFDASSDNILIPLQLIEAAVDRDIAYSYASIVAGLDVGMSLGGDPSALIIRQGGMIRGIFETRMDDSREIAGWAWAKMLAHNCTTVAVDALGWGKGVADIMPTLGAKCVPINVAESSAYKEQFNRYRDELWWTCREWFAEKQCSIPRRFDLSGKLIAELSGVTYTNTPSDKIKIQSKQDMVKEGKKSPNLADALCLTFAHAEMFNYQVMGNSHKPRYLAA